MSIYHTNKHMFITNITLLVKDLEVSRNFYEGVLRLSVKNETIDSLDFYAGSTKLITLIENKQAKQKQTLGLYHFALLVSSRASLAHIVKQFIDKKYPITGASDHGVSEALYLNDPDGNGIEIYTDRDKAEWPKQNGNISMYTESLDFESLMKELPNQAYDEIDPKTVMGHVHFHVGNIKDGQEYFIDTIHYDVVMSYGQGSALFVSNQGYHHHVGMNVWSRAPKYRSYDETGLVGYTLQVPSLLKDALLHTLNEKGFKVIDNSFTDPLNQMVTLHFS